MRGTPRHYREIEQEMTRFLRRAAHLHMRPGGGGMPMDKAAYGLLCRLADQGSVRTSDLAMTLGLDVSTVSRHVAGAEALGYVAREPDPADRRAALLTLTDSGREALDAVRAWRWRVIRSLLADWNDEERATLARIFGRLNTSLEEFDAREAATPTTERPLAKSVR